MAFYRLAKRLKERFPRLPIMLTMDGLYAGGPTFSICEKYGWKYMIVLKDKDLKTINQEFHALRELQPQNRLKWKTGKDGSVIQKYSWVSDILYEDSYHQDHTITVLECLEIKLDQAETESESKFKWVTNFLITQKNVVQIAHEGGRNRWKVENEGFNVQKNGGYELEHAYTTDHIGAKIFYLFLQIAHIISQLILKGSLLKKMVNSQLGSNKNLGFRILDAWRNAYLTKEKMKIIQSERVQIRFGGL